MFKKFDPNVCLNSQGVVEVGSVGKFFVDCFARSSLFSQLRQGLGYLSADGKIYTDLVTATFLSKDNVGEEISYEFVFVFSYYVNVTTLTVLNFSISCNSNGNSNETYINKTSDIGFNDLLHIITLEGGIILTFGGNSTYYSIIITDTYNLRTHASKPMIIEHTEQSVLNEYGNVSLSYKMQLIKHQEERVTKNFTAEIMNKADFTEFYPIMFSNGFRTRNVMWSDFTELVNFSTDINLNNVTVIQSDHDDMLRDYRDDKHNTRVWGYRIGHLLFLND